VSVVDTIGWIAALSSASLAVPQGARIAITRSVAGVSTTTWQTMLIAGIAWTAHGLLYGTQQIIWPNLLLALTSAWVLWQLTAARRLPVVRTWSIPVVYAGLAFAGDITFGPLAFAALAFIPGAIGQFSQLREILRDPDLSGVSMVALLANLLNQVLWFSYALPARELAVLSISPPMACIVGTSIVALWWRRRLAAARLAASDDAALALTEVIPQPVASATDAPSAPAA
jgi:uncharacterized protein with PQ loop repeat